jgi:hypothetical protein
MGGSGMIRVERLWGVRKEVGMESVGCLSYTEVDVLPFSRLHDMMLLGGRFFTRTR